MPTTRRASASTLLIAALGLASASAHAARPFVTDDARIVDKCQIETYYKEQQTYSGNEFWFLPACNAEYLGLPFNFEITAGGNRVEGEDNGILQVKFLLKTLETNGAGYAVSLGKVGGQPYFNTILSRSILDDRVVFHANLGGFRDTGASWGYGAEVLLWAPRVYGIFEGYGVHRETPTYHYGARFWVVPDHFQVDMTQGQQTGTGNRRFYTVGLRFLFP